VGSIAARPTRVRVEDFARPLDPAAAQAVLASLPDQLAARALREVIARIAASRRAGRPVVAMCGGHIVKVGVSPCLIALMEHGVITHLALNGAAAIHDVEIARAGSTSEDVEAHLHQGSFGMVDETGTFMNQAAIEGARRAEGLGEAWGRALTEERPAHLEASLLAAAWRLGVPATLAEAHGASVLNLGSAVLLPEVFLKALAVARNLGADLSNLTTVNLDQIQHYRPRVNVIERPTRAAGSRGYALTGHHEIMIPLLAAALLAELAAPRTA